MEESKGMSKDRIKEEISGVKIRKLIYFWVALSFLIPGLGALFILPSMAHPSTPRGSLNGLIIMGVALVIVALFFGKKYLNKNKEYKELRNKL